MPFATSSMIGVDLNNPSSTALFGLGTKVTGSDNSEWEYVIATGTLTTGMLCWVNTAGTAQCFGTGQLNALQTGGADIGVAQFTLTQGQYGFVAKRGTNLYILCSGTVPGGAAVGIAGAGAQGSTGALTTAGLVAAGFTAAGIFITTSASTAGLSVATGIVTWPRVIASAPAVS